MLKMKTHTKRFFESRHVVWEEPLLCEWCFERPMVDVHHVKPKGMGGSKKLDYPENLIGLCRKCHTDAHASLISKNALSERVNLILELIKNKDENIK